MIRKAMMWLKNTCWKHDISNFDMSFDHLNSVISLVKEAKESHIQAIEDKEKLYAIIAAAGGYVWLKDLDGRYLFCDPTWCQVFFKMERGCDEEIVGRTDKAILTEFRGSGHRHTYGNVCKGTDQHCLKVAKKQHYIEFGWIEDDLFVIDVIKTPFYSGNKISGTVGFARNLSDSANWVCEEVQRMLTQGNAEIISKQGDCVAAYLIKNEDCRTTAHKCLHFPV